MPSPRRIRQANPARANAFTLVELLVVIGIIALLISILLPTLGKAKARASEIKCLSNLKSLGQAFLLYSGQNRGCALPSVIWDNAENSAKVDYWPELLIASKVLPRQNVAGVNDAIAASSVFVCPTANEFTQQDSMTDGSRRHLSTLLLIDKPTYTDWSYGINGTSYADSNAITKVFPSTCIFANTPASSGSVPPALRKITAIRRPAEVALLFDGREWNIWNSSALGANIIVSRLSGQRHGKWKNGPDGAGGDFGDKTGRTNILFYDGHAATVDRNTLPGIKEAPAMGNTNLTVTDKVLLGKKSSVHFRLDL